MKLNNIICNNAKPKEKSYKLFDGQGLYIEIMPTGGKLWRLKYRYGGKEKRISLGAYPEISIMDAREKKDGARKLLSEGFDPSVERKDKKARIIEDNDNTFEKIAREWHALKLSDWSEANAKNVLTRLEKDVFPIIGKRPIKNITHKMLLDLANKVKERGAHELAKRIIQTSVHIFQFAVITGRADKNIAADLKGMIKPKPKTHFAAIEAKELPQFMRDLREHKIQLNRQTYMAVHFMMLTFVRTGEMIKAEWDEFDFDEKVWIIPAHRMKMNRDHMVPLSKQAIEILEQLRELHNHPVYVFPSRTNRNNHMSNNTILMALDRMGYRGKMTGHGFRSLAMSTIMERLGYRKEVPDAQLAHAKKGDVARAYERAQYLEERTKMMQEWADYIEGLEV
ncbi:MAG: integrase [Alphaproteobacteria bacterium]|nr:MAG: integrase [Alphaproteobacteria bacterium]